jgi:hypothetical protein
MGVPKPISGSFQEKFCEQFAVPVQHYEQTVLRMTLYPHARWLSALASTDLLAADRHFVAGVGRLTRWRDFDREAQEFQHDPRNRLFHRRGLCLRVSVYRMRVLFSEVWGGGANSRGGRGSSDGSLRFTRDGLKTMARFARPDCTFSRRLGRAPKPVNPIISPPRTRIVADNCIRAIRDIRG